MYLNRVQGGWLCARSEIRFQIIYFIYSLVCKNQIGFQKFFYLSLILLRIKNEVSKTDWVSTGLFSFFVRIPLKLIFE